MWRAQDCAAHTLVRGVPEVIDEPRWQDCGRLATHGIGVGMTREEADNLAHAVAKDDILAYADAVHAAILVWPHTLPDDALDAQPNVPAHFTRYPVYLEPTMREEAPWMFEQPPVWHCLAPAIGHDRDHLAEIDLLKRQLRARRV